jgi:hypothetical protein
VRYRMRLLALPAVLALVAALATVGPLGAAGSRGGTTARLATWTTSAAPPSGETLSTATLPPLEVGSPTEYFQALTTTVSSVTFDAAACGSSDWCLLGGSNAAGRGVVVQVDDGVVGQPQVDAGTTNVMQIACQSADTCWLVVYTGDGAETVPYVDGAFGTASSGDIPYVSCNTETCWEIELSSRGVLLCSGTPSSGAMSCGSTLPGTTAGSLPEGIACLTAGDCIAGAAPIPPGPINSNWLVAPNGGVSQLTSAPPIPLFPPLFSCGGVCLGVGGDAYSLSGFTITDPPATLTVVGCGQLSGVCWAVGQNDELYYYSAPSGWQAVTGTIAASTMACYGAETCVWASGDEVGYVFPPAFVENAPVTSVGGQDADGNPLEPSAQMMTATVPWGQSCPALSSGSYAPSSPISLYDNRGALGVNVAPATRVCVAVEGVDDDWTSAPSYLPLQFPLASLASALRGTAFRPSSV